MPLVKFNSSSGNRNADGSPVLDDDRDEKLHLTVPSVELWFSNEQCEGVGTL
jgi:hypothetical protein